jgi:membrane protein CcdC involved in cytochrome C biogenesis
MPFPLPSWLYVIVTVAGAVAVLTWRAAETRSPVTPAKIVIPPLGMSTGLSMFLVPVTRVPWNWALGAVAIGATLFAWPLIRASTLTRVGDHILLQRSKAFLWLLIGLVVVRFALRAYVERTVSTPQTGALFFLLGLGAVVRWRALMLRDYLRLVAAPIAARQPPAYFSPPSEKPASTSDFR